jgi:hypothetical protein
MLRSAIFASFLLSTTSYLDCVFLDEWIFRQIASQATLCILMIASTWFTVIFYCYWDAISQRFSSSSLRHTNPNHRSMGMSNLHTWVKHCRTIFHWEYKVERMLSRSSSCKNKSRPCACNSMWLSTRYYECSFTQLHHESHHWSWMLLWPYPRARSV